MASTQHETALRLSRRQEVLLYDDDMVDRRMVTRLLDGAYQVDAVESADAFRGAVKRATAICALLDYRIPGVDSMDLARQAIDLGMPVIFLTGQGDEFLAVEAMKLGARDYLPKAHVTAGILLTAIQAAADRAELERRVAAQQQELESFISVIGKDLKYPLKSALQSVKTAQRRLGDDVAVPVSDSIRDGISHMERAVEMLDGFSRYSARSVEEMRMGEVDLAQALQGVSQAQRGRIEAEHARIVFDRLPKIYGDRDGVTELLQSLVLNSLAFRDERDPVIRVTAEANDEEWTISVEDNGLGIPLQYAKVVFDPFWRAPSSVDIPGCGLGLAVCQRIVRQHGGRIWVEERSGPGATVRFTMAEAAPGIGTAPTSNAQRQTRPQPTLVRR